VQRVFGSRTVVEAAFLVAVPAVALALGVDRWRIIGASAVAYLLVLLVEALIWRLRPGAGGAKLQRRIPTRPAPSPAPAAEPPATVVVVTAAPAPTAPPVEPAAAPEPEPVRVLQPVPDPEPEPEPEPVVVAPPAGAAVVPIGVSALPRQWNLWDLERLTREGSTGDAILDEERSFLLMYLREFAGPDGELPVDFDGLVRDSFGELVGAR
jgi:hypothetical protein